MPVHRKSQGRNGRPLAARWWSRIAVVPSARPLEGPTGRNLMIPRQAVSVAESSSLTTPSCCSDFSKPLGAWGDFAEPPRPERDLKKITAY